uniref:Uncharacterized protein n=1 Tax=Cyanothece sp. (strain PCC 7425 / ATCC 29141) TaxID=395961 RepID=B8HR23_CYAP4
MDTKKPQLSEDAQLSAQISADDEELELSEEEINRVAGGAKAAITSCGAPVCCNYD